MSFQSATAIVTAGKVKLAELQELEVNLEDSIADCKSDLNKVLKELDKQKENLKFLKFEAKVLKLENYKKCYNRIHNCIEASKKVIIYVKEQQQELATVKMAIGSVERTIQNAEKELKEYGNPVVEFRTTRKTAQ